jgi:hypothetical protein
MKLLLGSFWRAVAYCLHPKVIALSLLPLLVAGVVRRSVRASCSGNRPSPRCARRWSTGRWSTRCWSGCRRCSAPGFRTGIAALIVIALSIPVVVAFTLVLVALWITPAIGHAGLAAALSAAGAAPRRVVVAGPCGRIAGLPSARC